MKFFRPPILAIVGAGLLPGSVETRPADRLPAEIIQRQDALAEADPDSVWPILSARRDGVIYSADKFGFIHRLDPAGMENYRGP